MNRKIPVPGIVLAALALGLAGPRLAVAALMGDVEAALSGTHYKRCAELVREAGGAAAPRAKYVAGTCLLKLHEPRAAQAFFEAARDAGFVPAASWRPPPAAMLARLDVYESFLSTRTGTLPIEIDAPSEWTARVVAAAPSFLAVGRRIFGGPPPATRLFLFSDFDSFERFYDAAVGPGRGHGTGGAGLAVMPEKNAVGREGALALGVVLHETAHAWFQGYGRDRYDQHIFLPAWADEGLADYVMASWDEGIPPQRAERLRRELAKRSVLPSWERFSSNDFRDKGEDFLNYLLARALVIKLIGEPEQGLSKIPAVLDGYARKAGDEAAWQAVSGKSPRTEYQALVSELGKVQQ